MSGSTGHVGSPRTAPRDRGDEAVKRHRERFVPPGTLETEIQDILREREAARREEVERSSHKETVTKFPRPIPPERRMRVKVGFYYGGGSALEVCSPGDIIDSRDPFVSEHPDWFEPTT